jgi:hypothetical protein
MPVAPRAQTPVADLSVTGVACLNCSAPLTAEYCSACGQRAVDLGESSWQTIREAFSDAFDFDGRVLRTVRALKTPGHLTVEFVRGRRAPYVGPLKILLFAGAALTTTWILTRGIDMHYYGFNSGSSSQYINNVVRGSFTGCVAVGFGSWVLTRGRRRLLDEMVFALHVVAALLLLVAAVVWLGTAWKLIWGTAAAVPSGVPALPFLLYLPSVVPGLAYVAAADRRVHGGAWWVAIPRALIFTTVALAVIWAVLFMSPA